MNAYQRKWRRSEIQPCQLDTCVPHCVIVSHRVIVREAIHTTDAWASHRVLVRDAWVSHHVIVRDASVSHCVIVSHRVIVREAPLFFIVQQFVARQQLLLAFAHLFYAVISICKRSKHHDNKNNHIRNNDNNRFASTYNSLKHPPPPPSRCSLHQLELLWILSTLQMGRGWRWSRVSIA